MSGVAIIAKELWSVPLWLTNTVLNIQLFAAGFFFCGWTVSSSAPCSPRLCSLFPCMLLPEASYLGSDLFLSALFGGIISGVGTGLVFLTSCTTGGTDLLAALIQKRLKHYTLAQIMQVLDGLIGWPAPRVFGIRSALYALIAIFCGVAKVTDGLIEGLSSPNRLILSPSITGRLQRPSWNRWEGGVTSLEARGMYSDQEKKMLFLWFQKRKLCG